MASMFGREHSINSMHSSVTVMQVYTHSHSTKITFNPKGHSQLCGHLMCSGQQEQLMETASQSCISERTQSIAQWCGWISQ